MGTSNKSWGPQGPWAVSLVSAEPGLSASPTADAVQVYQLGARCLLGVSVLSPVESPDGPLGGGSIFWMLERTVPGQRGIAPASIGVGLGLRPQPVLSPLCCMGSLAPSSRSVGSVLVGGRPQLLGALQCVLLEFSLPWTLAAPPAAAPMCRQVAALPFAPDSAAVPLGTSTLCPACRSSCSTRLFLVTVLPAWKVLPVRHLLKVLLVPEDLAPEPCPGPLCCEVSPLL